MTRDDFSKKTITMLAERVGFICSNPTCRTHTVGPHTQPEKSTRIGVAAHITAAALGGPRHDETLTTNQRKHANNGIWLCSNCANLIDKDMDEYPTSLLNFWKVTAESEMSNKIKGKQKAVNNNPSKHDDVNVSSYPNKISTSNGASPDETFICLDVDLIFVGIWKSSVNDEWTIIVKDFKVGNEQRLREYGENYLFPMRRYIIIESQSQGRLLKDGFQWLINNNGYYELKVHVCPPLPKMEIRDIGTDYAHSYDGDLLVAGGDFKRISGYVLAKQLIERNLSLPLGGWFANQLLGSLFTMYYQNHYQDPPFLNQLIKIELIRLMTIPSYQTQEAGAPELNFINKIIDVNVLSTIDDIVPVFLSLEWTDGTFWSDTIHVSLYIPDAAYQKFEPPEFVKQLFSQEPFRLLDKLTAKFTGQEMKLRKDDSVIYRHFTETLPNIINMSEKNLEKKVYPLFESFIIYRSVNNSSFQYQSSFDLEMACFKSQVHQIGLTLNLRGFKKAGVKAFDITNDLFIYFDDYHYSIGDIRQQPWSKKLYDVLLDDQDILAISAQWLNRIVSAINQQISEL